VRATFIYKKIDLWWLGVEKHCGDEVREGVARACLPIPAPALSGSDDPKTSFCALEAIVM
jgi:hypothetical protein